MALDVLVGKAFDVWLATPVTDGIAIPDLISTMSESVLFRFA